MLSSMSLRLPTFRLIKDGKTLPESSYTKSGRTGSKTMTGHHRGGAGTANLQVTGRLRSRRPSPARPRDGAVIVGKRSVDNDPTAS